MPNRKEGSESVFCGVAKGHLNMARAHHSESEPREGASRSTKLVGEKERERERREDVGLVMLFAWSSNRSRSFQCAGAVWLVSILLSTYLRESISQGSHWSKENGNDRQRD
jgi:hypothetical protein